MIANHGWERSRIYAVLSIVLAACILLTVLFDLLESGIQDHSAFYLSESFLFSSFWWLFLPLLLGQFFLVRDNRRWTTSVLVALISITIHVCAYPALVWLISALFYPHAFAFAQTFEYGLTQYGFVLLIVYSGFPLVLALFRKQPAIEQVSSDKPKELFTTLLVSDGNKRSVIETKDILYFSASPPYIYIHHKTKRYLHNETLRSMLERLDSDVFVRVHKSSIVNISEVRSYKSRSNGDYDLIVSDGTELRLSRNYAAAFKQKFQKGHQDTTK